MSTPSTHDVSIDGRNYFVDTAKQDQYWSRTVPLLRQQSDASSEPSEASLNPEGAWLRGAGTWHRGAGQANEDDEDSVRGRFFQSLNMDPWTKGELKRGHGLEGYYTPEATATRGYVFWDDIDLWQYAIGPFGVKINRLNQTTFAVTATESTGTTLAGFTTTLACTDGTSTWFLMKDKLVRWNGSAMETVYTQAGTPLMTGIGYSNGRLLGWGDTRLYDLSAISYTTGASLPAELTSLSGNSAFMGVADGIGYTYLLRNNGAIYKFAVAPDGTSLGALSIAGQMPKGEKANSIFGYLGFTLVGTARGIRLATSGSDGNLTFGSSITDFDFIDSNFVAYGRFVYCASKAMQSRAADWTGAVRLDLSVINDLQPAFASDFTVETTDYGVEVYDSAGSNFGMVAVVPGAPDQPTVILSNTVGRLAVSSPDVEPSDSWLDTGKITYGLSDSKESVGVSAVVASGSLTVKATSNTGATANAANALTSSVSRSDLTLRGQSVYLRLTPGAGCVVDQVTLRAFPALPTTDVVSVPLLLFDDVHAFFGDSYTEVDVEAELSALYALRDTGAFVTLLEMGRSRQVQVVGVDWFPDNRQELRTTWNGTAVVTMKTGGI